MFTTGKSRNKRGLGFGRDSVVGILLNLDSGTPLANTMSLFRDPWQQINLEVSPRLFRGTRFWLKIFGMARLRMVCVRPTHSHCRIRSRGSLARTASVSEGRRVRNRLRQALFPHVIFRHVTLQVALISRVSEPPGEYGTYSSHTAPLPATCMWVQGGVHGMLPRCRMLQAAAKADVEETADPSLAGKFEVPGPAHKARVGSYFATEILVSLDVLGAGTCGYP